ncbi:hypothetical protein A5865_003302, partial [Enterococcus sp. 12E11_DIV0728]
LLILQERKSTILLSLMLMVL